MKKLIFGIGSAALLSTFGCGEMMSGDPELTCATAPQSATLATNVQAVFDAKCTGSCHLARDTFGDFTTAEKTKESTAKNSVYAGRNATLKVVDGEAKALSNSSLWLKVIGGSQAGRTGPKGENVQGKMPDGNATPLTDAEKQLLKDWICTGAK